MKDPDKFIISAGLFLLYCAWFGHEALVAAAELIVPPVPAAGGYSAADLVTVITAVTLLIGSLVTGIIQILASVRTEKEAKSIKAVLVGDGTGTNKGVVNQLTEVHTATNANMTEANNEIKSLRAEIKAKDAFQAEQLRALTDAIKELKVDRAKQENVATGLAAIAAAAGHPAAPAAQPGSTVNVDTVTAKTVNTENLEVKEDPEKK